MIFKFIRRLIDNILNKYINKSCNSNSSLADVTIDITTISHPGIIGISNPINSVSISTPGRGYTSAPSMGISNNIFPSTGISTTGALYVSDEIIIKTVDGREIKVGNMLCTIIDQLELLIPDQKLIATYPSLKNAWDEYKKELNRNFKTPKIQAAIDNYKMIAALVKVEESGEH
jgi:hypothetical protein